MKIHCYEGTEHGYSTFFDVEKNIVWRFTGESENIEWAKENFGMYKETYRSKSGSTIRAITSFKPTMLKIGWFTKDRQKREIAFEHEGKTYFWYAHLMYENSRMEWEGKHGAGSPMILITNGEEIFVASSPDNALRCIKAIKNDKVYEWREHSTSFDLPYTIEKGWGEEKEITVHYGDSRRRLFGTDLVRFVDVRNGIDFYKESEVCCQEAILDNIYSIRVAGIGLGLFRVDKRRRLIVEKVHDLEEAVRNSANSKIVEFSDIKFVLTIGRYGETNNIELTAFPLKAALSYCDEDDKVYTCTCVDHTKAELSIPWHEYHSRADNIKKRIYDVCENEADYKIIATWLAMLLEAIGEESVVNWLKENKERLSKALECFGEE